MVPPEGVRLSKKLHLTATLCNKTSQQQQIISVLITCTFMFRQVCTIEPSFFNTSGMHRRPFGGRHLFLLAMVHLQTSNVNFSYRYSA